MKYTLQDIASRLDARLIGDPTISIEGVATLTSAGPGQITFLTNPKYRRYLKESRAGAVIISEKDADSVQGNALIVDNPHASYALVATLFSREPVIEGGVHDSATIDESALIGSGVHIGANACIGANVEIGERAVIGPNCVIEEGCSIGADSRLMANVTVYYGSTIGERALIHAGVVIGSDGFGFANDKGRWIKVPQLGSVVIGDDVEIGANTTIDRGAIENTEIGNGVKLDNLIQVAHNVKIGENSVIAGCVGIAGSATIGKGCAIAGGVGILGHLEIVDGVTVTAMSLVTKSIKKPGVYSAGTPLEPIEHWQKNFARFKQLDDMARRLRELEKEIKQRD